MVGAIGAIYRMFERNSLAIDTVETMRIGIVSDTHIPGAAAELPEQVAQAFRGVDLILHGGDIYTPSVLDELERIAPVLAAKGDDDNSELLTDSRVRQDHTLKVGRKRLWLIHMLPTFYTSTLVHEEREAPDIIVFGHQHAARVKRYGKVLLVNPGSPTCPDYCPGLGTVAILDIDSGEAQAYIVPL